MTWPITLELLLTGVINTGSTYLLNQYSQEAVAVVGSLSLMVTLTVNLYTIISIGGSVLLAPMVGAGKNQEAGKELTSIMLMKGMRHLALLGGNESYNVTGSRYQGFLDAHQELGIPVDKNLIFMNADNQLVVSDAVSKLYEAGADGIVCMDDVICSMCMSSLREKKIQVPMQMKVASMYDSKIWNITILRLPVLNLIPQDWGRWHVSGFWKYWEKIHRKR